MDVHFDPVNAGGDERRVKARKEGLESCGLRAPRKKGRGRRG